MTKTRLLGTVLVAIGLLRSNSIGSPLTDTSATWLGADGDWTDGTQWSTSPIYPNNGNGLTFDATINGGSVNLDRDITIQMLSLTGGNVHGGFTLTLNEGLNWTGGSFAGDFMSPINVTLAAGSQSSIPTGGNLGIGTLNNYGAVDQGSVMTGVINNMPGATWTFEQSISAQGATFNNAGTFVDHGSYFTMSGFNNSGVVTGGTSSSIGFTTSGGTASGSFTVGEMDFVDVDYNFTTGATVNATTIDLGITTGLHILGNSTINANINAQGDSFLGVQSGAVLTLNGTVTLGTLAGIHLSGGTISSAQPLSVLGGTLSGSGTINGNLTTSAVVSPGGTRDTFTGYVNAPGTLTVNGNLSLLSDAKLVMEIGGLTQGTQTDYLTVNGLVTLGGNLELLIINGFNQQLNSSQTFTLLSSTAAIMNQFANVANGSRLTTEDGSASFQVNYGPGSPYGANNLVLSNALAVPEPSTIYLLASGTLLFAVDRANRRRSTGA